MNASPNRVVAIATPLVFAPLAGAVAALAARYAPGLDIDEGQLVAVFIAGATIAFAKAGLWLKGWQDYEKHQEALHAANFTSADDRYLASDDDPGDAVADEFDADFDDADFDDADLDEEIEDEERDAVLVAGDR